MLIMLDKRQRQVIAMSNSVNLQHQSEVFRSLNVEGGSKTPYTDATQVSLKNHDTKWPKIIQNNSNFKSLLLYYVKIFWDNIIH